MTRKPCPACHIRTAADDVAVSYLMGFLIGASHGHRYHDSEWIDCLCENHQDQFEILEIAAMNAHLQQGAPS